MDASDGTTQKVANSFNFAKINFKGAVSTAEESTNAKQYAAMVNFSPPVKNKKSIIGLIQAQLRHGGTIYSKTIRSQPTTTTVPPTTTTTTVPPTTTTTTVPPTTTTTTVPQLQFLQRLQQLQFLQRLQQLQFLQRLQQLQFLLPQ